MSDHELLDRITVNADVMAGKPVIRGTRLTVDFVLGLLARGASADEILAEYPGVSPADVSACLLFAAKSLADTTFVPATVAA